MREHLRVYRHELWRVVEAQHTASTMRLSDTLAEQHALERVLEASKPALADEAHQLHYLLATPFRYRPAQGSRFRAAHAGGIWYGAEQVRTALAEKSYWRLRFLLDAPAMLPLKAVPHTLFATAISTEAALDLTATPYVAERTHWIHPTNYAPTQAIAAAVQVAGGEVIRYESVRDPEHAACCAVLIPAVFARSGNKPKRLATWFIAAARDGVRCAAADRTQSFEFGADTLQAFVATASD